MKKHVLVACLMFSVAAIAQDCKSYYYLQKNKVIEITMSDKKGNTSGKLIYTVSDTKPSGQGIEATVNSEVHDKKDKVVGKGVTVMKCEKGVLMMDLKMSIPQPQIEHFSAAEGKANDVYMEYPADMKVGDQLKDGYMMMELNNSGLPQTLTYNVNNRKVEGKESVTTPAGTWECYKISFKGKMNMKMMVGVNINMDGTEWFAPGFGVVKSQTKNGSSEVTAVR